MNGRKPEGNRRVMQPPTEQPAYVEEAFGILTDDQLYLDCILVRPPSLPDEALRAIRVWVPKTPLTKVSLIGCARQEVAAAGSQSAIAHLVFDLRGTGESDYKDANYEMDLQGIRAWALERFGPISIGFYGTPDMEYGRVHLLPLRPAVPLEHYVFPAVGRPTGRTIVYLATYGNFVNDDAALCRELAQAGYHVYALDPLRYLLHASAIERLSPPDLWQDFRLFLPTLPGPPIVISQPIAAGLGLVWAAGMPEVRGAIVIGRAQMAFRPAHIFKNENPHTFFVSRYAQRLSPRPLVLVMDGRSRREDADELATLYQMSGPPRRLERTPRVDAEFLLRMLTWIENRGS